MEISGKIMRNKVEFYLNGKKVSVGPNHAKMMLADYLRYELGLTGTKIVCGEGDCGSCSVLKYFPNNNFGKSYFILINSFYCNFYYKSKDKDDLSRIT